MLRTQPILWTSAGGDGVTIQSGTPAWSPGSWVEVIASTPTAIQLMALAFSDHNLTTHFDVEVSTGAAGLEDASLIATRPFVPHNGAGDGVLSYPFRVPIDVPAGARVSLRLRHSGTLTQGLKASLGYTSGLASAYTTTQPCVSLPFNADGVSLTPSATPGANSGWVELTSGLPDPIKLAALLFLPPASTDEQVQFDLGLGGSGSETVISVLTGHASNNGGLGEAEAAMDAGLDLPRPYSIPASTRIAVRMRHSGTGTAAYSLRAEYYGDAAVEEDVPDEPDVETRPATGVRSTRATLKGRIDPNDNTMAGRFAWGTAPGALSTETVAQALGTGTIFLSYSQALTGLTPNTTYYFRAIGNNGTDDFFGDILSFTTGGEQEFVDGEVSHPLTWTELTTRDDVMTPYAEVDLNDRTVYYGGYKAPRVLRWMPITRGASDRSGQLEHMAFGSVLSDAPDRPFRGLLEDDVNRYLTNRPNVERMIDDEDRRVEGLPRIVANGYISDYKPLPNLQFQWQGCDWLKKKFSRKAKAQRAWQPAITIEDFTHAADEVISDSGTTIKVGAVGKAAPLWYGKVSSHTVTSREVIDPGTGARLTLDPTLPDAGVEVPANANGIAGASTFAPGQNIRYVLTIVDTDTNEEGPYSRIIATMNMVYPDTSHTALSFEHASVPGRNIKYRVYLFDGYFNPNTGESIGNTFVRYKEHDDVTEDGFFGHPLGVEFSGPADGLDWFTEATPTTSTVDFNTGKGAITPIWVGPYVLAGTVYQAGLLARGAIKNLEAGYVNGVEVDLTTDPNWGTYKNAALWATLGFTDPFIDFNGHRYSLIFLSGVPGNLLAGITAPAPDEIGITVDLWGVEDIGDASGTLIESLPQQNKHFVRNFLAPDSPPGTEWLTESPTFPHLPDLPMIDEDSFDTVEDGWEERLPGGAEGAGGIGANGELVTALDALAWFNQSGYYEGGFTRKGQYQISIEPAAIPLDIEEIDDVINIIADSFTVEDRVQSDFFNILPYVHTRDYTDRVEGGWFSLAHGDVDVRDAESIEKYDQEREAPRFEFQFLRSTSTQGAATIAIVLESLKRRYRQPLRVAIMSLSLSGTRIEWGQVFKATHIEGIGASGWIRKTLRCLRHELDPNTNRVRLEAYDVEQVFSSAAFFSPTYFGSTYFAPTYFPGLAAVG